MLITCLLDISFILILNELYLSIVGYCNQLEYFSKIKVKLCVDFLMFVFFFNCFKLILYYIGNFTMVYLRFLMLLYIDVCVQ